MAKLQSFHDTFALSGVSSLNALEGQIQVHVPMLDLQAQYAGIREEIEPALLRLCASQHFILGPEVEALENEVARYVRAEHAVGCASGTDALVLALMVCGIGADDQVVTPSFTFVASAEAVAIRGAEPVFVDIDPSTFNMDPQQLEDAITPRTRAIIPVDLFGQCADISAIREIAERHGLPVIEDAAQSLGSEHHGKRAGELATLTAFSFYPSKNLGGFGDGGLVTTQDAELARQLRELRVHGETSRYVHGRIGINSRLDALQAAVLRLKLRYLDRWTQLRQEHAAAYVSLFAARGLADFVHLPVVDHNSTRHVFNQFTVRVKQRDALREYLAQKGVSSAIYYPIPLHQQQCFRTLGAGAPRLQHTERAAAEVLSLPMYPELSEEQRSFVVECVAEFYASH